MADRQLQTILNSGGINSIYLGGTAASDKVQKQSDIAGFQTSITTNTNNIATNTTNIAAADTKANQFQKTGVKSGFVATITDQPVNDADTAEVTLQASGSIGQIATKNQTTGEITLASIALTNNLVFEVPRISAFLLFKQYDGTTLSEAAGFAHLSFDSGTSTYRKTDVAPFIYTIQWVESQPNPSQLKNHIQFAKIFGGSTAPNWAIDTRLVTSTNPTDLEAYALFGNLVLGAYPTLNIADNTKLNMSTYTAFRLDSGQFRDDNWMKIPAIDDIMAGGSNGAGGRSNAAKGHLYNLKIKDNDLASWSYAGTTITLNTTVAHKFEVGNLILVEGLTATTNAPNSAAYPDDTTKQVWEQNTKWTVSAVPTTTSLQFVADVAPTGTPAFDGSGGQISKNNIGLIEIVDIAPGGTYAQWWNYYDDSASKFPSTRHLPVALASNEATTHEIDTFTNWNENNIVLIWGQFVSSGSEAFDDAKSIALYPLLENSRAGKPGGSSSLGRVVSLGNQSDLSGAELLPSTQFFNYSKGGVF